MKKILKVGMIGCGGNAQGHLRSLINHPETEVVALVEPAAKMIKRTRQRYPELAQTPVFSDHRQMLKQVELDGVAISTPHTLHFRQVMDSLNAGLHVICEKPLVCSLADTKKVIAKAKQKKKVVVVAYQRRFLAMRRFVRRYVHDKDFGKTVFVQSFLSQEWLHAQKGTWRQNPKLSGGGQLNDSGSHIIDMIFWTLPSKPVQVTALIENHGAKVDIDSAVSYRLENGGLGNLSVLGTGPRACMWEDMSIVGSKGRAIFFRNGVLTLIDGVEIAECKKFGLDQDKTSHWIDVIKKRVKNESPPEGFLRTIAFTEACWKSAKQGGKPVNIKY